MVNLATRLTLLDLLCLKISLGKCTGTIFDEKSSFSRIFESQANVCWNLLDKLNFPCLFLYIWDTLWTYLSTSF